MHIYEVLRRPVTTEKSARQSDELNQYTFEVDARANKHLVKEAVETAFNVKVTEVRTAVVPGKVKRMGRYEGKTPTWKKAIVRLKKDQVIAIFENA